ncbi:MAG: MBL fold metallo-hydrolase, partial [Candidatus Melainabacteria bacterium]|nr:MBL fold metallo-hydrolase [Candidatus Melainabacteria bacterium]
MPDTLPLIIEQFELGPMDNYIYIVGNSQTKEAVVVDPAWDVPSIEAKLAEQGLELKAALITHGHPDHTNGIEELLKTHDIPVYVSEHEASFYKPIGENIKEVDQNYQIELGDVKIDFVHTPGHTPGSQCFHVHGNLISGDTLFLDGCGRCDLPGGDAEVMYDTIANKLMTMPDSTIIYPGHNYHHLCCDSLEQQKQTNPYLQAEHLNQFISRRMG